MTASLTSRTLYAFHWIACLPVSALTALITLTDRQAQLAQ